MYPDLTTESRDIEADNRFEASRVGESVDVDAIRQYAKNNNLEIVFPEGHRNFGRLFYDRNEGQYYDRYSDLFVEIDDLKHYGMNESKKIDKQAMFDKEKTEHPALGDTEIWQIVNDHINAKTDIIYEGEPMKESDVKRQKESKFLKEEETEMSQSQKVKSFLADPVVTRALSKFEKEDEFRRKHFPHLYKNRDENEDEKETGKNSRVKNIGKVNITKVTG